MYKKKIEQTVKIMQVWLLRPFLLCPSAFLDWTIVLVTIRWC